MQLASSSVSRWLFLCVCMVALMVLVGGLTRLTESGLSMVEWQPATLLPPLTAPEWAAEFEKYQTSPQYQQVNRHLDVEGFKQIFWLEYIHRLLGRCVGVIFLLPLLYFLARRMLTKPQTLKLAGIFLLGSAQGLIGWLMVKSGLQDQPWVSPVRLAMHLGMAFLLFALLLWQWLSFHKARPAALKLPVRMLQATAALLYVQILLGALVAGMDAGLVFNTFPHMNGQYVPEGIWAMQPVWQNLVENPTTAHAVHRYAALLVTGLILWLASRLWQTAHRKEAMLLILILSVQVLLGALTVIHAVPILLASLHQMVALLLWAVMIYLLWHNQLQRRGLPLPLEAGLPLPEGALGLKPPLVP